MQTTSIKYSTACSFQPFQPVQKDSAGFPWCHAPKASSAFSFFSCLTSLLFSAQKNTKITNETSACCKLGHKVMERYLVTIRQQFPEKKLYSTFIHEQTVLLLSLPTIPNIIRQVKQVCVQNFVNKKYSSAVPQRKNCKHVTFCEARLLLLVGREASADQ